ncbi:class I SAM-dependent methyltransferase [bacterium]|nr:class I SAM-dependent methyltransferase [bacterium]
MDIGCGIGRNLKNLDGNGVGLDHNPNSVSLCRLRGFQAFTPEDFRTSNFSRLERFDSILVAHVLEHLNYQEQKNLLLEYLPYLKKGGKVVLVTPQERGYASDSTHVSFVTNKEMSQLASELGLEVIKDYSFPFPRSFGKIFIYNEFVLVLQQKN